jgi:hypothetical protein
MAESQKGDKSHLWQGGKTTAAMLVRNSLAYTEWRSQIFGRDEFTCQLCRTKGGRLAAHHIKPFSRYPHLQTYRGNGITLCWPCHCAIKGNERRWESRFLKLVGNK